MNYGKSFLKDIKEAKDDESERKRGIYTREMRHRADGAMVLGSGLGGLSDIMDVKASIPYGDIPGFVRSTAIGHAGKLLLGTVCGVPCAMMSGRNHIYEGYTAAQVAYPIYVLRRLGAENLILTNAAGAVNQRFVPGDLMLITDHLNLMGVSPIVTGIC